MRNHDSTTLTQTELTGSTGLPTEDATEALRAVSGLSRERDER